MLWEELIGIKPSSGSRLFCHRTKVIAGERCGNLVNPLEEKVMVIATRVIAQHCTVDAVLSPHGGVSQGTNKLAAGVQHLKSCCLSQCASHQVACGTAVVKDQSIPATDLDELKDINCVLT